MYLFIIKLSGVFLGVVARSLLPWLRKLRDNEIQGFDRRYLISAFASFIICFIITLLIFPHFTPPTSPAPQPASNVTNLSRFSNPSSSSNLSDHSGSSGSPETATPSSSPSFEDYFKLFCLAFGFGFGFDGIIKEAGQWLRLYRRRLVTAPPSSS